MSVLLHFFFLSPKNPNQNNFSILMTEEPMSFFSTRHSFNKHIFKFLNFLGFSNQNKKNVLKRTLFNSEGRQSIFPNLETNYFYNLV